MTLKWYFIKFRSATRIRHPHSKDVGDLRVARVLCVANQKGGVGKTTTATNLAYGIALSGRRTLLVDLDPQCNATSGMGVTPLDRHPLVSERALQESVNILNPPDLSLLPGSRSFRDIEILAGPEQAQASRLRAHLAGDIQDFEYVFIDCPPSLGQLTRTALSASNEVVMPIQCEYFAMEGLTQMIQVIREVMKGSETHLEFGGIVLTMYDESLELTQEVEAEVRDFFGEIVFNTVIPRDVAVAEAPSYGRSVLEYAPRSRGAWAYTELCLEVM